MIFATFINKNLVSEIYIKTLKKIRKDKPTQKWRKHVRQILKQSPEGNSHIPTYRNWIFTDHWERVDYFVNGLRTIWFPYTFKNLKIDSNLVS